MIRIDTKTGQSYKVDVAPERAALFTEWLWEATQAGYAITVKSDGGGLLSIRCAGILAVVCEGATQENQDDDTPEWVF
jgi:hypothetical protein